MKPGRSTGQSQKGELDMRVAPHNVLAVSKIIPIK